MDNYEDGKYGVDIDFSPELLKAIEAYDEMMVEYGIPPELSAQALMHARMQTIMNAPDECGDEHCTGHDLDNSPANIFIHDLLLAAKNKKGELSEEDVHGIADIVSDIEEAMIADFMRIAQIVEEKKASGETEVTSDNSVPSPFI